MSYKNREAVDEWFNNEYKSNGQIGRENANYVKNGSGKKADILGYAVIGKTGTADIPCEGSYGGCGIRTSFVGAFPGWNPRYALLVSFERPKANIKKGILRNSSYWNAGPAAGNIIKLVAPILGVEYNETKEIELPLQNDFINAHPKETL